MRIDRVVERSPIVLNMGLQHPFGGIDGGIGGAKSNEASNNSGFRPKCDSHHPLQTKPERPLSLGARAFPVT